MAIKRIVDIGFWVDDKVLELFSPEDKLFMLYLLTNPHTTQLGIYKISKKIMGFELGYSIDTINILLDRFENKYQIIKYSPSTNEIAIRNYLKYSIVKGGKPVEDCLKKELSEVKDKQLITYIFNNIKNFENLNETVKYIINNYNIYNDNDNEVSYNDTYDDTYDDTSVKTKSKRFVKPTIKEIDDYCKERGNNVRPEAFYDFYESKGWVVGKSPMKDWKAAVRTWEKSRNSNRNAAPVPDWFNKDYSEKDDRELSEEDYEFIRNLKGSD